MRVLVDMDGIVTDLLGKWLNRYNAMYGDTLDVENILSFDLHSYVHDVCGEDIYRIIEEPGFFDDLDPLPGAIAGVNNLREKHEVRFATACAGPDSARAKLEWIERHFGLDRRHVFVCHDKDWIEADAIIDDKPDTLVRFAELGRRTATIAYPYNRSIAPQVDVYAESYEDPAAAWAQIVEEL